MGGFENVQFCLLKQHSKMLRSKQIQTIEGNKEKNVRKYTRSKQHNLNKKLFLLSLTYSFQKLINRGSY